MHLQIPVKQSIVNLALHASAWSMHVKRYSLWNGYVMADFITSHPPYSIASYVEDTPEKPEWEVKDLCYFTRDLQLSQEFLLFQAVWWHFFSKVEESHTSRQTSTCLHGNTELNSVVPWCCSLRSNGTLNKKMQLCSNQQTLLAPIWIHVNHRKKQQIKWKSITRGGTKDACLHHALKQLAVQQPYPHSVQVKLLRRSVYSRSIMNTSIAAPSTKQEWKSLQHKKYFGVNVFETVNCT